MFLTKLEQPNYPEVTGAEGSGSDHPGIMLVSTVSE
jgi:hypothetical protein